MGAVAGATVQKGRVARRCLGPPAEARPTAMQLLEDPFFSRRLPAPEQHRRPIAAQIAEKEAEERSSRSLAAHDSGSSEGDNETARCEVRTRSVRVKCFLAAQFCPGSRWRFRPDGCVAVTAPKLESPWNQGVFA